MVRFETKLHVHRLFPGSYYWPSWCVTLCKECHDRKPRKAIDVLDVERSFVAIYFLNLLEPGDRAIHDGLTKLFKRIGGNPDAVLDRVFRAGIRAVGATARRKRSDK